jgi:hypothetical protein
MNIETKIRKLAAKKIRVTITSKKRSRGGFYVWHPMALYGAECTTAKTKAEALQILFAKLRCYEEVEFKITRRAPHVGDKKGNQ